MSNKCIRSVGCIFGELLHNGLPIIRGSDEMT